MPSIQTRMLSILGEAGDRNWPGHEGIDWKHAPEDATSGEAPKSVGIASHGHYLIQHPHSSQAKKGYRGQDVSYRPNGGNWNKLGTAPSMGHAIQGIAAHHQSAKDTLRRKQAS